MLVLYCARVSMMPRGQARYDSTILEMALVGYQAEKEEIESTIREIQAQLKGSRDRSAPAAAKQRGGPRVLSAAARERIAAAQRKRWAEFHKHRSKGA
jgi:hypothetical protein